MLRKLATQVERTVGQEHQCGGSRPRRNVEISDTLNVDLYEAKALHFRRYAWKFASVLHFDASSARVRVTADASTSCGKRYDVRIRETVRDYLFFLILLFRQFKRSCPKVSASSHFLIAFDSSNAFFLLIRSVHGSMFTFDFAREKRYVLFIFPRQTLGGKVAPTDLSPRKTAGEGSECGTCVFCRASSLVCRDLV